MATGVYKGEEISTVEEKQKDCTTPSRKSEKKLQDIS